MINNSPPSSLSLPLVNSPLPSSKILMSPKSKNSFNTATDSLSSSSFVVLRRREVIAWIIIIVQTLAIVLILQDNNSKQLQQRSSDQYYQNHHNPILKPTLTVNEKPFTYHEKGLLDAKNDMSSSTPYYDPPSIYPQSAAGLVSRVWHSNNSPNVGFQNGSCWCSTDDYCLCTPSLSVDIIITSSNPNKEEDVWLVKRRDTDKLALMGGYHEVGETSEEAGLRELKEEMGLDFHEKDQPPLQLIGVYSDPKRDYRKHSVSVVYHMEVPADTITQAGDDAMEVVRIPLSEIENMEASMHIDHKTVLHDFIQGRRTKQKENNNDVQQQKQQRHIHSTVKRSICKNSLS